MMTMERTYTIPLRRETQKTAPSRKAKKAVTALKEFLTRHMKVSNVGLGPELNEKIWARGIQNPPHKVTVSVKKDGDYAYANLVGKSLAPRKVEQKGKETEKNLLEKQIDKLKGGNKPTEKEDAAGKTEAKTEDSEKKKMPASAKKSAETKK